jgi:hypothetical protein
LDKTFITALGLGDITRLLESTQMASIDVGHNAGIFNSDEVFDMSF